MKVPFYIFECAIGCFAYFKHSAYSNVYLIENFILHNMVILFSKIWLENFVAGFDQAP